MSRWRALLTGSIVALLCLGPVAAPADAALPAVGSCQADAELVVGDTGPSVICLQFALGMMHLSNQPISGTYDESTADSVRFFQAVHPPLRVDGRAGPRTLEALGIWSGKVTGVTVVRCQADATIEPGEVSPSVQCMQQALGDLGLYDGPITGISDLPTVAALRQYQLDTPPLQVDGWGGPRTLAAMGIWSGSNGDLTTFGAVVTPYTPGSATAPPGPWPAGVQLQPNWNLTADGLPYYGNRVPCSRADADMIAYQFAKDGADVETQQWAVYIATREGGCRYDAVNVNPLTLDDSHCSFQLNALSGMFAPGASLGRRGWTVDNVKTSMQACADAASDLWVYCGRGPWTPPYSCRAPWKDTVTVGVVPAVSSPGDG